MKCTEESSGYCTIKIKYNKYTENKICEDCCAFCLYQKYCEDICCRVKEGERNEKGTTKQEDL